MATDRPRAGVRARLFDADGHDRTIDPDEIDLEAVEDRQLAWIDIDLDAADGLDVVAAVLKLGDRDIERIGADTGRARVVQSADHLHVTLEALEPEGGDRGDGNGGDDPDGAGGVPGHPLVRHEIDLIAARNLVVTVHRGRILALDRYAEGLAEDSALGVLDAGDLLSGLVDEVIGGYYRIAESIEREIDRLDEVALRGRRGDVLAEIVAIRRRIAVVRRVLVPHRDALAMLARPEMDAESDIGRPWPGLTDRLAGAIETIEGLRDALLGTYDIHMGRVAQHANDVTRLLTILSAILLPAVVLAGIMGMNFEIPFFDEPGNFLVVIGTMVVFGMLILGVARWRRWL